MRKTTRGPGTALTGQEVRRLRLAAGLTQRALAERLEVSEYTVSRWEHESGPARRLVLLAVQAATAGTGAGGGE